MEIIKKKTLYMRCLEDMMPHYPNYEKGLLIKQEKGDQQGEGTTLTNIGNIYHARGDYETALRYLEF